MVIPSKKDWINIALPIIAIIAIAVLTGLNLCFGLPLFLIYGIQFLVDKKFPNHRQSSNLVSHLALLFLLIFGVPITNTIFKKDSSQICGTLVKNDYQFFNRSIINPPNVAIEAAGELKEFRTYNTHLPLGDQVCVNYVKGDDTIWFFDDYVLSIHKAKS